MNLLKSLILIMTIIVINACAPANYLRTDRATAGDITGTYTLLLHGGRYIEDLENVAILDREGDPYIFRIYAPEYDFTVRKGLPAREALEEAEKHVRSHRSVHRTLLKSITDKDGNILGYELRPLYFYLEFGTSDILSVYHRISDGDVISSILLNYDIDRKDRLFFKGN